jgi:hypothetical protein
VTPDTRPDGSDGPDGPDGPDDAPTGTVAQEAALLVNLLSTRGWGGDAPGSPHPNGRDDAPGAGHPGADAESDREGTGRTSGEGRTHECTCGGTTPAACRVCPVCQLISFVQQVSPDAIERLADVVGLAATALRDLAASQREQSERPGDGPEGDGDREGAQPAP